MEELFAGIILIYKIILGAFAGAIAIGVPCLAFGFGISIVDKISHKGRK